MLGLLGRYWATGLADVADEPGEEVCDHAGLLADVGGSSSGCWVRRRRSMISAMSRPIAVSRSMWRAIRYRVGADGADAAGDEDAVLGKCI